MSAASSYAIGIDLGTTNSCVAIYYNGKAEVLANEVGQRTTPSYVGFKDDEIVVGQRAQDQAYRNLKTTIFDVKRLMGKKYNDAEIQEGIKFWPFDIIDRCGNPEVKISVRGKENVYCPEQISAEILKKMKEIASKRVATPVTKAVITVPAYFNDSQRRATKYAGELAGLEVLMLLNEPTAAAITYALDTNSKDCEHALVFDLGGGTFDVSIIQFKNRRVTVKAIHGDSHLGGNDFDKQLLMYLMKDIQEKCNCNIQENHRAMARLLSACEKLKKAVSYQTFAEIDLDVLIDGKDYYTEMKRETFEDLNKDLFSKTLEIVEKCLMTASLIPSDIDNVVLVGGSTKIPRIQFLLQHHFKRSVLSEVLNPDEAVAMGAAIQAANLSSNTSQEVKDFVLEDVVPISLGIAKEGDIMGVVIKRYTVLPATVTGQYANAFIDTDIHVFTVYEGENKIASDNHLLGRFELEGIPQGPRGSIKFDVTFNIDVSGILNVTATERSSKKTNNITITIDRGRLSKEALEKITN